jgi:hypothetical protein
MDHNVVKSSSPNVPSTDSSSFVPCPRFPTELASILLLAFTLFALVAALSQCLCSESPYSSIKLFRINACYTNSVWYYPQFYIIVVGLGMYYLQILGHTCTITDLEPPYQENTWGIKQGLHVPRIALVSVLMKLDCGESIMNRSYECVSILCCVAHCL